FRLALLEGTPKSRPGPPRRGARSHSRPGWDELLKAKRAEHRNRKQRITQDAIVAMNTAISRGVSRDSAIAEAIKTGVTYKAIGKERGLARQRVHQIVLQQEALNLILRGKR